jgi:hypothetical protein
MIETQARVSKSFSLARRARKKMKKRQWFSRINWTLGQKEILLKMKNGMMAKEVLEEYGVPFKSSAALTTAKVSAIIGRCAIFIGLKLPVNGEV